MRLLSGSCRCACRACSRRSRGTGRFMLESATISGVPVPEGGAAAGRQLLLAQRQDNPNGVGLDDAFALPAAIREIRVQPGQAIVVQ